MISSNSGQRAIRVFVSSTFRDMQAEREELVKFTFPKLRKLCEEREVSWGEVDLRWGITDEQARRGEVLPICLEEIRACRPYFIGMLGERYGWVPEQIPQELIDQESWLQKYLEHSVTELEIIHGVLRNPEMTDHAYFYLRDPAYLDSLPADKRAEFQEVPAPDQVKRLGQKEAERRADTRRRKLTALKERICRSGFPVRKNYRDPAQLGELVYQDLRRLIDKLFPDGRERDPLDREAAEHEVFAKSRAPVEVRPGEYLGVYVGGQDYLDRLNAHAEQNGPPLAVTGESGSGKSALLSNWAFSYRSRHPDVLLIMHFIGASLYSADWMAMLRRIMGELRRRFDLQQEIPEGPDALRKAFANWLYMAAAKGRVVLILDALNQLDDRDGAPDLVWLPSEIPPNIRLIVSTLPGRSQDEILKRKWPRLCVKPLQPGERRELIKKYLAQYRKKLSDDRSKRIAEAPQTANPLYLRALLEELRIFGIHEELDQRIGHYLSAPTVKCLYEKVLERYEQDYQRDYPGLVGDAMSLLWAARRGLSETELLDLLRSDRKPLPRAHWSPLYLAAEQSLVNRSGLLGFFHHYFRQAVRDRYLSTGEKQRAAHLRLADYFRNRETSKRRVDELPWQLAESESWRSLYELLADLPFFQDAWQSNEFDVKEYWARMESSTNLRKVEAYRSPVERPEQISGADSAMYLARLLKDTGNLTQALRLWTHLVKRFRGTGEESRLASSLSNMAVILRVLGNPDGAMTLHKKEEGICRKLGDREGLHRCLGNQALIHHSQNRLNQALALHQEEEQICRELNDKTGLAICLGNQAAILCRLNDMAQAVAKFDEQERVCRELGNKDGLISIHANQALIHKDRGEPDLALAQLSQQERVCRQLGDRDSLQEAIGNQGLILRGQRKFDGALVRFQQQERICRELGNQDGLQRSLGHQAQIHLDRERPDLARPLLQEQEGICRRIGEKRDLEGNLEGQAQIHIHRGETETALVRLEEQTRILRELEDQERLSQSLTRQAGILATMHPREALPKAEEAYRLATSIRRPDLAEDARSILSVIRSLIGE